ncbi:MAG: hypothetical protein PQJ46_12015 [Spirochaetales bacterium]|nr:hypothetical protein [Spirochaetales bacterium]
MQNIRIFSNIPEKIPRYKILKRLGYHSRKNDVSDEMMSEVDKWITYAADLIELKALSRRESIKVSPELKIDIPDMNLSLDSSKLAALLKDSDQLLFMGITGGNEIMEEIKKLQAKGEMTAAVIVDAAASEIVDEGFEWITALYRKELVREGRTLTTRRFSAGYGDFDLEYQKVIYKLLGMKRIDVSITDSCILIPEKSVTALCGILKGVDN